MRTLTDYEKKLVALAQTFAGVRVAAEALTAYAIDAVDDDSVAAPMVIRACREQLLIALEIAPALSDIFTVTPER